MYSLICCKVSCSVDRSKFSKFSVPIWFFKISNCNKKLNINNALKLNIHSNIWWGYYLIKRIGSLHVFYYMRIYIKIIFMYESAKVAFLYLVESMKRIQRQWLISIYSLWIQIMEEWNVLYRGGILRRFCIISI